MEGFVGCVEDGDILCVGVKCCLGGGELKGFVEELGGGGGYYMSGYGNGGLGKSVGR